MAVDAGRSDVPDTKINVEAEDREAEEEKEDPLVKAKREQEELEQALEAARDVNPNDDPAMKAFYADMKEVDRENQVNRVLGAFKLNPYEMLGLRFDAPEEDISRMYRKVSLAVHPDKCSHPRAKDAFEIIGHAQKELQDPEKKQRLDFVLQQVKDSVISDWKKAAKDDPASQLAVAVDGLEAVVQKWLATDEFHDAWKMKARDVLAKTEWRRRKMAKRLEEETERAKEESKKRKEEIKQARDEEKKWETTRDDRVGNWRDFMKKKKKKSRGGSAVLGGLKPPKSKIAK
mmetsp:Transcript_6369/g.12545  ORF Transcript_6369/g.12545 Transcript_6369/m.12545 type:complete len:289 (-) Transcript_6369:694-1560(-)